MKKLLLALCIAMLCFACHKEEGKSEKKEKVSVALAYKARSFDPSKQTDSATMAVCKQIYSNLFALGKQGEILPELAESYSVPEKDHIEIVLKKGVKFHDGKEMKAKDVIASLKHSMASPVAHVLVSPIEELIPIDDYRFQIVSKAAPSLILHNLTHGATAISKKVETEQEIDLLGTGPFQVKDWGNGEKIVLEAFPDFFQGKPTFKELVFLTIPENSNRVIALETGEIDLAYDIVATDLPLLSKDKGLRFYEGLSVGSDFLSFNCDRMSPELRRALALAVNKESMNQAVFEGKQKIADSILPPTVFGYSKAKNPVSYDIEKAQKIMRSLGYGPDNLCPLKVYIYEEASRRQIAEIIQATAREAYFDIEIQALEVSSFLQFTAQGQHDFLVGLWYVSSGDADYGYYPLLHSSSKGAPGNRAFYDNKEMDALLDRARYSPSEAERKTAYTKAQSLVERDLPIYPLFYKTYFIGMQDQISGFEFDPRGSHVLYHLQFEQNKKAK